MKYLLLIALISLSGCGWFDKATAYTKGYSEHCINGVVYIQFTNGASVKYDKGNNVVECR